MPESRKLRTILILLLTAALLIFAPLIRSGKTADALLGIELLGLLLFLTVLWNGFPKLHIDKWLRYFIIFGLLGLGIYLIPLPDNIWQNLPNRGLYAEVMNWVETSSKINAYQALSLVPLNTLSVLLSCIPALALFFVTTSCTNTHLKWLIYGFLFSATLQAGLGLLQYLTNDPYFYFGIERVQGTQGTYLNRNHFTAFMEMAEPLALALMIYAIIEPQANRWLKAGKILLFAAISLLLTFIAFTTTSRMGTALLILSILLSFWVMTTPGIRKKVAVPIFILRVTLLGVIIFAQYRMITTIATTASEMKMEAVLGDLRWEMFAASWEAIKAFFPFGSGPGTMPQIAPAFLPDDHVLFQTMFINHVHNDYLELVMETGLFGIVLISGFFWLYIRQWLVINRSEHSSARIFQSGAGVSILLFLIFGLTDFNLHTPANVVFLVFLCGVFFRTNDLAHTESQPDTANAAHNDAQLQAN